MYYDKNNDQTVTCRLCPHNCHIAPGRIGVCRVRGNVDGELYSLNYARVASIALDPIEKKPLYKFHPGSNILSAGSLGCNLKCSFCQNWGIAQQGEVAVDTVEMAPEELAEKAVKTKADGNIGVAYTYNEPSIWYEYVLDTAKIIKKEGLNNVLVTNGFISEEPLRHLLPYIDAMNIDVKAFTESFYKDTCKGGLDDVRRTVEIAAASCHVELTTLVIPEMNDSMDEIDRLSRWIASISPTIPLHLSRFFPQYKMKDKPPTPVDTLIRARDTAKANLEFVYLGNV